MASRMESSGTKNQIQISERTYNLVKDYFKFKKREKVDIKGIGLTNTYYVIGREINILLVYSIIHNICYMQFNIKLGQLFFKLIHFFDITYKYYSLISIQNFT